MVEENQRQSAHAQHAAHDYARRSETSHRLLRTILVVAIGLGLALIRYGMRAQMREDAARGAGFNSYSEYRTERDAVYPTDEYSYRIHDLANDMCSCKNLACARDLQAQYTRFIRSGSPADTEARESAEQDGTRLVDCEARFETAEN